jgi:hypothetical protein
MIGSATGSPPCCGRLHCEPAAGDLKRLADRKVMVAPDDAPEPQVWLLAAGARAVLAPPDRTVLGAARSIQDLNTLAAI